MLRVSSEVQGQAADLHAVVGLSPDPESTPVPGQTELLALVEGTLDESQREELPGRRDAVAQALGDSALVDAAAVIGNFQRMVRIADGTGIPLDDMMVALSADVREELGLNQFSSAEYTKEAGFLKRQLARWFAPLMLRKIRRDFARAKAQ